MIKKCEICQNDYEAKRSNSKYCSRTCQDFAYRERRRSGSLVTHTGKPCALCGDVFYPKNSAANQRQVCYSCLEDGKVLTRGLMLDLIRIKHGGKCCICGYDKYLGAIHFHHINPKEKDFTISNDRVKLVDAIAESEKCVLLCANCHAEVHANLVQIKEENKG